MRKLIAYALILVLAVWLGICLAKDPGYVLISYKHWTAETSLWFAAIAVLALFLLLFYLFRFFYVLAKTRGRFSRWRRRKQFLKAHTATGAGLLALEESDWALAESLLLKGVGSSTIPVINYLSAAKAAQAQNNTKHRDKYLVKALAMAEGKQKQTVLMVKADLQIQQLAFDDALLSLQKLQQDLPKHPHVLQQLSVVYRQLERWSDLQVLLPLLRKKKVLAADLQDELERQVFSKVFVAKNMESKTAKKLWKSLTKPQRQQSAIALAYVQQLTRYGYEDEAEQVIADVLKESFSERLVKAYGKLHKVSAKKRLAAAQQWLQQYGESVVLLTSLSRIAMDNKALGEAKSYLERALSLEETTTAYNLLATIYEMQGDQKACAQALNKALMLSVAV